MYAGSAPLRIEIPGIWLGVGLSLLLHLLLVFGWTPQRMLRMGEEKDAAGLERSLEVRLVPIPAPAPPPPPAPPARAPSEAILQAPVPREAAPRVAAPPPAPPRVIASQRPADIVVPPPAPPPAQPATPPAGFSAFVASRQRAREAVQPPAPADPAAPAESERERHSRQVASNLGLDRTPTFGGDNRQGGGIFQVTRVGFEDGEFIFFGWNRLIQRSTQQTIEVKRGNLRSTEQAIVRRMIQIIREHEKNDFIWESQRLGRNVTLSARPAHDAELEEFLRLEFFSVRR